MKTRVGLFFNGSANKHDDSFDLAFRLMAELPSEKVELVPIYLSSDNLLYHDFSFSKKETFNSIDQLLPKLKPVSIIRDEQRFSLMVNYNKYFSRKIETIDVGFLCLKAADNFLVGLQGYFQLIGLPYTGTSVEGTILGYDRVWYRQLLNKSNVEVVDFIWDYSENIVNDINEFANKIKKLGLPCTIDIANATTISGQKVIHTKDVVPVLESVIGYGEKIIVDKELSRYQEFSCAYLGNRNYEKTSAIAKYAEEKEMDTSRIIDYSVELDNSEMEKRRWNVVDVSKQLAEDLKYLTMKVCRLLDLQGVVRITFIVSNDEKNIKVKDIDILPSGLAFMMFEKQGINVNEIARVLLQNAIVQ